VLEAQPEHETARGRLERVYEGQEKWDALVESLRQRLERAEDAATREAILLRIADLQDLKQDNPDAAIDTIESLLAEQPGLSGADPGARAIGRGPRGPARAPVRDPPPALRAGRRRDAHRRRRRVAADADRGPVQRHELLREIARCSSRRAPRAPSTRSAPSCAPCRARTEDAHEALDVEIARLSRQHGYDAHLREAQLQAAESERLQSDAGRRVSLMLQAAQLAVNAGDNDAAIKILRHALEVGPDDRNALALLDEALTLAADFEGLRAILERRVEVADDDDERIDLLRRLARLVEEGLGQPDAAEAAWQRILDIEPDQRRRDAAPAPALRRQG
jgi:tetratricopeptide (TPR) repeat protein